MRELKFRAWDEEEKEMKYFTLFHSLEKRLGGFCSETMQYIGLKDSKGKEIYEGDVIKTKKYLWLVEPIGSEERDGNQYGLCVSKDGNGKCYFIDSSILAGEVVGNIYENPKMI